MIMDRREFLKKAAVAAPVLGLFPADLSFLIRENQPGKIEKRSLGKTGAKLSILGFGGIVVMNASAQEAAASVKQAVEAGINYFDVAPSYGNAEEMLGPALEPYRKDVFLSDKTGKRTADEARIELEQSLKLLRTDYFDLYQLHAVTSMQEVETIFGKGGAMETFLEARKEGKIKHIGFSAHSVEAAIALMDGFDFETIMFPFHLSSWNAGNFGPQVLDYAAKKGMGIIALKAGAKGRWAQGADRMGLAKAWYEPFTKAEDMKTGLRFTLSHPITTAIPPGEAKLFELALSLRNEITPMTPAEIEAIKKESASWDPIFTHKA
jgi:aryl-alcohol dehydrogenase-like predicted oxidoreductase